MDSPQASELDRSPAFDPLDRDFADAYTRHMEAAYLAGREDGWRGGLTQGLVAGVLAIAAGVLAAALVP